MSEPVLPPLDVTDSERYTATVNRSLNDAGKSAYMDLLCRERQLLDALTRASKLEKDLIHQRQETEKAVQRVATLEVLLSEMYHPMGHLMITPEWQERRRAALAGEGGR